jgi:D-alanine transaminase
MARAIYVNGRYLPYQEARIHAEDRGFLFGDAVYEVCPVLDGRLVDEAPHLDRLERSLRELRIAAPMARSALSHVMRETVRRNRVSDGWVYLEVSRGAAPRDFLFPSEEVDRTVVCLARSSPRAKGEALAAIGIAVVTTPDQRWARPDIKTVQLLAPALAKELAKAAGAKEAWLVDRDGNITEGASSNAWIVTSIGEIVTRAADQRILRGVTRVVTLGVIGGRELKVVERPFSVAEAKSAREAFVTSATNFVMPVVAIDGQKIGDGKPGRVTLELRRLVVGEAAKAG